MKTKKRAEQPGQTKGGTQKISENTKGGGYIDAKDAKSKPEGKGKGKSRENVRTPN